MISPEPLPLPVFEILANPNHPARYPPEYQKSMRHSRVSPRLLSRFVGTRKYPDTPAASFYRLYEFFVVGHTINFRNELEYFTRSHPDWSISSLPDPKDPDPLRYATLAVLTRLMCAALNRRIELGLPRDAPAIIQDWAEVTGRPKIYEHPPHWVKHVQPLDEQVFIPNDDGKVLDEGHAYVSAEFKAMRIIAQTPHINFI